MKTFTYIWYKPYLLRFLLTITFCVFLLSSLFANVYSVTNLNDSGPGSLRQVLTDALSSSPGTHTINATISGTINLQSPLPIIRNIDLTINGPSSLLTISRNSSSFFRIFTLDTLNGATKLVLNHLNLTNGNSTTSAIDRGGIILVSSAILEVNRCYIGSGTSSFGGAVCAQGDGVNVTIYATTISGCQSFDGGAIYINGETGIGTINLSNTSIVGNSAFGVGGGMFLSNANTTFTNCTVSSNSANKSGAGIYESTVTNLQLNNCTISRNKNLVSGNLGAGINSVGVSNRLTLMNTLVVGNLLSNNTTQDINWEAVGVINKTIKYSIVGVLNGQAFNVADYSQVGTSASPKIVSLGPLAYNGGVTPTHCLQSTSPELAIDQGNAAELTLLTDQRNISRAIDDPSIKNANGGDGSDIGAYESDYYSLPLNLLSFTGKIVNKNQGELTWVTAEEKNFDRFDIEWSSDAINWIKIGETSATGNLSINNYKFLHKQLSSLNYYRLKMLDKDAKFTYSQTINLKILIDQSFKIFPNPAKNIIKISFTGRKHTTINFYNIPGQIILKKTISEESNIDISILPPGVYTVEIIQNENKFIQKLLKQ